VEARVSDELSSLAANALVLSLFAAVGLGLGFLAMLRRNALACVKASCAVQVAVPAIISVSSFAAGAPQAGVVFLFCAALAAFAFWLWRAELALCARLLSVAAAALNENAHLVTASLGMNLVLSAVSLPLLALMVAAVRVGAPAPNALATLTAPAVDGALQCMDDARNAVACCMWQPAPAAVAWMVCASCVLSWAVFLAFEVRLFTIAHTVSRWYALPVGARLQGQPIREAMAVAVGPSFGSLCLGSAVLTAADMARQAAESARRQGGGLLACLIASVVACVSEILRLLTRFATVRCAITGEDFMAAARSVTDLLARHSLSAYGVWRFPPMVLSFTSLALAVGYAGITLLAYGAAGSRVVATAGAPGSDAHSDATAALQLMSLAVAGGALALVLVVCLFLSSIVVNIIDTVYLCYATDLDRACIVRPEVHAVFAAVPSVHVVVDGALIQQPDGELGYAPGAAAHQQQQQQQQQRPYTAPA
jgi:hypothetical protein